MNIFYHVYVKIINMISQKSHSLKLFLWKNIFVVGAGFCATFLSLSINTNKASALFVPTLSASVNQTNLQVNGNQVMNSIDKTTEILFSFRVKTNNRTGYTATLSSETENTALTNTTSTANAKINSISTNLSLNNFPNNTWGYKFWTSSSYAPIPALSSPAQILQTTGETNGNYTNPLSIGMKLADNLESGNYTNKLILSFVSNPYTMRAIMTEGPDFNAKLKALETATNKIEHFKKSTVVSTASMNTINIEDEESDYEIKLWLDPTDKTAYYYTEPEKVYLNRDSSKMFLSRFGEQKIENILELDLSNFNTSHVTNMNDMFVNMHNLTSLDLSNFDTSQVTDMGDMFFYASSLTNLNLSSFNTSKVTNMGSMFNNASSLTSLNLSNFDTSKVADMSAMFYNMSNLTSLNLSNFNTSKVTDMHSMFSSMSSLTSLNLSNFDTSKVTDMRAMFAGLPNLATLNLSSFDTSNVTNMSGMFYEASNLSVLNLSNFNTSKVTNMEAMFYNMVSLTSLDLSGFNTPEVTNMSNMFSLSDAYKPNDKLEKIYVNNDFNTSKLINYSDMLKNRKKLRGGAGSFLPDPSTANKTWLRIDDPAHGHPGYFTRKP